MPSLLPFQTANIATLGMDWSSAGDGFIVAVLVITGIERIRMDSSLVSVPVDMYFIPYSHGLPAVLLMSLFGALLC